MHFQQYFLGCLSQASYLIGDETTGRAVVVDPQRDVSQYLADAERAGLRIERVIETHFHADFLSGHLELAAATGATVSYGAGAEADFPIDPLADGQRIPLGDVELEIVASPGHTPESICIVVREHAADDVPFGVLTGDTLFIGDVGRPDLLGGQGMTADEMARQLYRSLHAKLLPLPDATQVFPAHGAGSACGKKLSSETSSTMGDQRRTNYALAPMSEDEFVAIVTEGQTTAPPYFPFSAHRNREVHALLDDHAAVPALSLPEVLARQRAGAVVVDSRPAVEFAAGHLPGAVNITLEGRFAEWAGDVLRPDQEIVLVCEPGHELEARVRLARIGFDQVAGVLGDVRHAAQERSSRITAEQFRAARAGGAQVVDVRNPGELEVGAVPGSLNIPLPQLVERMGELDPARTTVVYCASGNRSSIAASVLTAAGFADVSDLLGGYAGLKSSEQELMQ
jgi:glyoxylase-like metal-dependent hydrolase (beta-lactamase superfamily II)/rhodanese-related sulfurtransferase